MSTRALPDLVSRMRVNTTELSAVGPKAEEAGAKIQRSFATSSKEVTVFEQRLKASAVLLGENAAAAEGLAAKTGALGKLGGTGGLLGTVGTFGGIAAAGLLLEAGKSAVEITEKRALAENDLAQALQVTGGNQRTAKVQLDAFIQSNRAYIKEQSAVVEAYAVLQRATGDQDKAQRDLNIAVDLAALKHIPLEDAVKAVAAAEGGRFKGLIDLGITTKSINADMANELLATDKVAVAMSELQQKTEGGRKSMTETDQATNKLSNDWQDMATKAGPPLIGAMDAVVDRADKIYSAMDRFGSGKDSFGNAFFKALNDSLINMLTPLAEVLAGLRAVGGYVDTVSSHASTLLAASLPSGGNRRAEGRASGGPVAPGLPYWVGEHGPEIIVPRSAGTVIPTESSARMAGGSTYNLTLVGAPAVNDPDGVRRMLDRLAYLGAGS